MWLGWSMATPPKFKPEFTEQASKLAAVGLIDAEIAEFFGVSLRTFRSWVATKPDFAAALRLGKHDADERVTRSLFQRAVGYTAPETIVNLVKSKDRRGVTRVREVVTEIQKHYPPDATSCIFWLKNRRPEEWREKFEHDHGLTASREKLQELLRAVEGRLGDLEGAPEGQPREPRRTQ